MKDGKLQVAQIGCGAFAEGQDMPNFKENIHTEVKWCCDISEERAENLARKFNVPEITKDFHDVIKDPEVDLIKICTSHEAHLSIIEEASAAGKHVFCEKPMALEEKEALKIVKAVKKGGIKLCVNFNRRMSPALNALKSKWQEHCANPKHQPWRYIETKRNLLPEEKHTQLLIRVQDESLSYRMVHFDPLHGGGQIMGETVHWLDLACWFFSSQFPVEIMAWGSPRFSHGINLTFSEGDTATIIFNCSGTFDYPKELYEVTAYGALLQSLFFVENRYYGIPGAGEETFPLQKDYMKETGTEGGFAGYMQKYNALVQLKDSVSKEKRYAFNVNKGHENMLNSFVNAVINNSPSPCDEMAGYLSTYLAGLAVKSIENRQILPVMINHVVPWIE